jgi:hypothetical protein
MWTASVSRARDDAGIVGDDEPACGGAPVFGALAPGTSVSRRGPLAMPLAGGGVGAARGRSVVIFGCSELTDHQM